MLITQSRLEFLLFGLLTTTIVLFSWLKLFYIPSYIYFLLIHLVFCIIYKNDFLLVSRKFTYSTIALLLLVFIQIANRSQYGDNGDFQEWIFNILAGILLTYSSYKFCLNYKKIRSFIQILIGINTINVCLAIVQFLTGKGFFLISQYSTPMGNGFYQPSGFSLMQFSYASVFIPLSSAFFAFMISKPIEEKSKNLYFYSGFLSIVGIGISFNRSVMLALLTSLLIVMYVNRTNLKINDFKIKTRGLFLLSGMVIIFTPILYLLLFGRPILFISNSEFDYSNLLRFSTFSAGINMFLNKPIFGHGIASFKTIGTSFTNLPDFFSFESLGFAPHNIFIELLSEVGLVGTLLFFTPIILIFIYSINVIKSKKNIFSTKKFAILFVSFYFVQYFIEASFHNVLTYNLYWIFLGFGLSIIRWKEPVLNQKKYSSYIKN